MEKVYTKEIEDEELKLDEVGGKKSEIKQPGHKISKPIKKIVVKKIAAVKKSVLKKHKLPKVHKLRKMVHIEKPPVKVPKLTLTKSPTLDLRNEQEIAMDFATRLYKKFDKIIKSVVLFGSTVKQTSVAGSDIDIIVILDDVSIKWDQELIAWYREELDKLLRANPYKKELHINTIKLSTWWEDLLRGDPVVINVIRFGEAIIDFGGFFESLKYLLVNGKIKSTAEAVYNLLQRAPTHIVRSKVAELNAIDGIYWTMVDSAHAALIAAGLSPPSPEHIPIDLKEVFVDANKLKMKYVLWYRDLYFLHRKIVHGELREIKASEIDEWQSRAEDFLKEMTNLVKQMLESS